LQECRIPGGAAGIAELLLHMQQLQQLTHLSFSCSSSDSSMMMVMMMSLDSIPTAAAYSALTASSKLRHLDIGSCTLPAGVWQYVFPAGRQLPHLRELYISGRAILQVRPGPRNLAVPQLSRKAAALSAAVLGCRHCTCRYAPGK
jgi:hypothetical protein